MSQYRIVNGRLTRDGKTEQIIQSPVQGRRVPVWKRYQQVTGKMSA